MIPVSLNDITVLDCVTVKLTASSKMFHVKHFACSLSFTGSFLCLDHCHIKFAYLYTAAFGIFTVYSM